MENPSPLPLQGRLTIITGGTDGIGKSCAMRLARLGADLVLVGRNAEKGQHAVHEIQAIAQGSRVTYWQHDLSLMREVQRLAEIIQTEYAHVDMLVQAAGVMLPRRVLTAEGLETVFAVQYLARFQLMRLLLEARRIAEQSHIVSVSAAGTIPIPLNFNNLNGERFYNGIYALIHESVANDLFGLRLLRLHPKLQFYNYGPFYVPTGLFTNMQWWFKLINRTVGRLVATTPEVASQDVFNLLTGALPSGLYSRRLRNIKPTRYRSDTAVQDRLWEISEQMIEKALAVRP